MYDFLDNSYIEIYTFQCQNLEVSHFPQLIHSARALVNEIRDLKLIPVTWSSNFSNGDNKQMVLCAQNRQVLPRIQKVFCSYVKYLHKTTMNYICTLFMSYSGFRLLLVQPKLRYAYSLWDILGTFKNVLKL